MKKILLLIVLLIGFVKANAQSSIAYGGYIKTTCAFCDEYKHKYYNFEIIVFFDINSVVPDSINLNTGNSVKYTGGVKNIDTLCSKILKVTYVIPLVNYFNWGFYTSSASFIKQKVYFSNNTSFLLVHTLSVMNWGGILNENISSIFKDVPIIEVEKGIVKTVNLFDLSLDNDSVYYPKVYLINKDSIYNSDEIKLNPLTGDLSISNKLDTGWYTIGIVAYEYNAKFKIKKNESRCNFSVHVTNKHVPYFVNDNSVQKDKYGIPFKQVNSNDKLVNYQLDYINTNGLGYNIKFILPSKPFNRVPTVTETKINDTLLRQNITFYLDSGFYKLEEQLPNSISVIVTTTDSTGNCKQDLTSFYLTNNPTNSINEVKEKNKISVYPNPATTQLNITSVSNIKTILVYNVTGQLVKELICENNNLKNVSLAIDELAPGMYMIQIKDEFDAKLSSKFIKE